MKPYHMFRSVFAILIVLASLFTLQTCVAQTIIWTGNGETHNWEDKENWDENRVPNTKDDVEIPANSGTITTNGGRKNIKSLHLLNSGNNPEKTILTARTLNDKAGRVVIHATGNIIIGELNVIRGQDGTGSNGRNGGDVQLKAGVDVINIGEIRGGDGVSSAQKGKGGNVYIEARDIDNQNGIERGGNGGNTSGNVLGGTGGNIVNKATRFKKAGQQYAGKGGVNSDDSGKNGKDGKVQSQAVEKISDVKKDTITGDIAIFHTDPAGIIDLSSLAQSSLDLNSDVCINAGSIDGIIDLRGNPAGTAVITSTEGDIFLYGDVLLDSGVTLADITSPTATIANHLCGGLLTIPNIPEPSACVLLGLGLLGLLYHRLSLPKIRSGKIG